MASPPLDELARSDKSVPSSTSRERDRLAISEQDTTTLLNLFDHTDQSQASVSSLTLRYNDTTNMPPEPFLLPVDPSRVRPPDTVILNSTPFFLSPNRYNAVMIVRGRPLVYIGHEDFPLEFSLAETHHWVKPFLRYVLSEESKEGPGRRQDCLTSTWQKVFDDCQDWIANFDTWVSKRKPGTRKPPAKAATRFQDIVDYLFDYHVNLPSEKLLPASKAFLDRQPKSDRGWDRLKEKEEKE
ncbi:hypothetical protein B7494_g8572, partial [Chlorociboria aeruginascens]